MKSMLAGFAAMILIAIAASYALQGAGFSTAERQSGAAVRLN
ncbi:MAG: hypothetical protein AB3N24_17335 [Leisingera sp.]